MKIVKYLIRILEFYWYLVCFNFDFGLQYVVSKGKLWPTRWSKTYPNQPVGSKINFWPFLVRVFGLILARNGKIGHGFLVRHPIRVNWSIVICSQLFGFEKHVFHHFFHYFDALIRARQNTVSTLLDKRSAQSVVKLENFLKGGQVCIIRFW